MSCLITCGLFVELGLNIHASNGRPQVTEETYYDHKFQVYHYQKYDVNVTKNPYGAVTLGWSYPIADKLKFSIQARHESSIATGKDKGTDSLGIALRWGQ